MVRKEVKINPELSIDEINLRIKKEICYNTLLELSDEKLINIYKECISVKNKIKKLSSILDKYLDEEIKEQIIKDYLLHLIPPGTKGIIRGNKFNSIIKSFIIELNLDKNSFEICFEKNCEDYFTSEIPDWYIRCKITNKIIIGMNQLDFWKGGQQLNRGSKYIDNNKHSNNRKLLCVICNEIEFKTEKSKAYKLFKIGFKNNTVCYLNNLQHIIISYFN